MDFLEEYGLSSMSNGLKTLLSKQEAIVYTPSHCLALGVDQGVICSVCEHAAQSDA